MIFCQNFDSFFSFPDRKQNFNTDAFESGRRQQVQTSFFTAKTLSPSLTPSLPHFPPPLSHSHSLSFNLSLSFFFSLTPCRSQTPFCTKRKNYLLGAERAWLFFPFPLFSRLPLTHSKIHPLSPLVSPFTRPLSCTHTHTLALTLTLHLTHYLTYFCWVYSIGLRAMNGSWREPDSWKLTRSGVRKTLSLPHSPALSLSLMFSS